MKRDIEIEYLYDNFIFSSKNKIYKSTSEPHLKFSEMCEKSKSMSYTNK